MIFCSCGSRIQLVANEKEGDNVLTTMWSHVNPRLDADHYPNPES